MTRKQRRRAALKWRRARGLKATPGYRLFRGR